MKQILKHLSQDIGLVLEANSIANEMDALIDYGEWSQCGPNFWGLIQKWKLTREKLLDYYNEAKGYYEKFQQSFPITYKDWKTKGTPYNWVTKQDINPWHHICLSFDCVFMAGYLNTEVEDILD